MTEETIFTRALEKSADERGAFLDEACAGDAALRERLEVLLRAHDNPGSFMRSPAVELGATAEAPSARGSDDASGQRPTGEEPGTRIGPYKLLEAIGVGGMGTVYMAEQTAPVRRMVALKVIKPGMDSRQVLARFGAERQAIALMDHPHIAKVLDAGTTEQGRPYFVMELVKGVPITQFCDERRLTPRERLELFIPVCQAVQHAHQKGIIHRDIKPSNVLVGLYDGVPVPKVIDFGVAKATGQKLTETTLFTGFGAVIGTPEYMSPEQAELTHLDIDTRSDIYSLGVLLYELLTGTTPIDRKRLREAAILEVLRVIRDEDPHRPSTRLSTTEELPSIAANRGIEPRKLTSLVRGELDWIVMKSLEKDRNRRYETANGLAADVKRYLADEPVQACPPSAVYRLRKFARRNRALVATGFAVGLAMLLAVIVLAVSHERIRRETRAKEVALADRGKALIEAKANFEESQTQEKLAREHASKAEEQRGIARANEKEAKAQTALANRRLYASQMNLAIQAARAGELPRTLELLESQRPTESGEDLRGFEWYYLWRQCHGGHRVPIRGHDAAVLGLSFSPDGRILASAGWDKAIRLWDTATGGELRVLRHRATPWKVVFSPDGQLLASGGQNTQELIIWDVATGMPLRTINHSVSKFAFTPDGKRLAGSVSTNGGSHVAFWDVETAEESARIESDGTVVGFAADGKSLFTFTGQYGVPSELQCWDVEQGTTRYCSAVPSGLWTANLSPDGSRILVATRTHTVVIDSATGKELHSIPAIGSEGRAVALSPDNTLAACYTNDRRVIVVRVESGQPVVEDVHRDLSRAATFSPDGRMLATASLGGAIHLRDLSPAAETVTLAVDGVHSLRFTPDSKQLFVGNEGRTKIFDVTDGKEIAQLPQVGVTAISDDVKTLARVIDQVKLTAWETNSGRTIAELPLPVEQTYTRVTLAPDGKWAATHHPWRADPTVRLWDLSSGRWRTLKPTQPTVSAHCAEFSPDGSLLAAGFQYYTLAVWDVTSGRAKCEFQTGPGMTNVFSVAWAPDSKVVAAGTEVGYVKLWDTRSSALIDTYKGHAMAVGALAFTPDGMTLATGSHDKTIRLWDFATGQERCTLFGHSGPITKLQFSPDGKTLASASEDGTLRLWRASTDPSALARRPDPTPGDRAWQDAFEAHQSALVLLESRDVDEDTALRSVELAKRAIELRPEFSDFELTLATAYYRAGQWKEAIAVLERLRMRIRVRLVRGEFVRAMCLWKLGQQAEARALYEAVAGWAQDRPPFDTETGHFHEEAAALLGLPAPRRESPLPPVALDTAGPALELRARLSELDEQSRVTGQDPWPRRKLAADYFQLAQSLRGIGDAVHAEAACRSSYALFAGLVGDDPQSPRFLVEAGWAANLLRDLLVESNRKEEALPIARAAAAWQQASRLLRADAVWYHGEAAHSSRQLAALLRELGHRNGVEEAEQQAIAAAEAADAEGKFPPFSELMDVARPLIERRDWKGAAKVLNDGLVGRRVVAPDLCFILGLIQLLAGDTDGYTNLMVSMPRQFMSHEWPYHIVRTLNLHPDGVTDPDALVTLAREALASRLAPEHDWGLTNLGTALYRAGQYDEALATITRADPTGESRDHWPIRAMIHQKRGEVDEARRLLSKANEAFRRVSEGPPEALKAEMNPWWETWAYFEVMLREADLLILGEDANKDH